VVVALSIAVPIAIAAPTSNPAGASTPSIEPDRPAVAVVAPAAAVLAPVAADDTLPSPADAAAAAARDAPNFSIILPTPFVSEPAADVTEPITRITGPSAADKPTAIRISFFVSGDKLLKPFIRSPIPLTTSTIVGIKSSSVFMNSPASGFSASASLFFKSWNFSAKSAVSSATPLIVSLPPFRLFRSSSKSRRPSRIAAAMSGPARAPKVSSAIAFASPAVPASLIRFVISASAFGGSLMPSCAILPSAMRSDPTTNSVLTPSCSNFPSIAAASCQSKPICRNGPPNFVISSCNRSIPMPVLCDTRKV